MTNMPRKKREYLIEGLLAAGSVNIICGPSGAGKTTWIFQSISEWLAGRPVAGHNSIQNPDRRKFFYLAADRDGDDVDELIDRVGLWNDNIPRGSLIDSGLAPKNWPALVPDGTSLVFLDGATVMIEGPLNDNATVGRFLTGIRRWAKIHKAAVILACHSPKRWKSDELVNARENILGAVAWGGYADTVFVMTEDNPSDPTSSLRTLHIEKRHGRKEKLSYQFTDDGRLIEVVGVDDQVANMNLLHRMVAGQLYTRKDLIELGKTFGVSISTVDRAIRKYVESGLLDRLSDGEYVYKGGKLLV